MEGSHGVSSSPAPFLIKTYDMLDDTSTDSIVSWSASGSSFIVWNPLDFARDLLPAYFKHNNFSSFIRQLNTYGFRKIDPERWEFANEEFIRGQKHLLKNIHRRKPIHSHSISPLGSNVAVPLSEPERQELKKEIERLKHDETALIIELQSHAQIQQGMDLQMQDLEERLQAMVLRQRNLISFLDQVIQRPGFLSNLIHQSDLHPKRRRLPKNDYFLQHTIIQDGKNLSFHNLLDIEPFEKMESSLNSLETFFQEVGQASGEDAFFEERLPRLTAAVLPDIDSQSPTPHSGPSSSCPEDINLYPDLSDSPTQAESTSIPSCSRFSFPSSRHEQQGVDIDMNSEPVVHLRDRETETPATTAVVAGGVNDTFWEQFLTESPCYCDAQESQPEKSDIDDGGRRAEEVTEQGRAWWSRRSVDHLTERMGHLTSAERTA
ncbi:LOW QUALITY PROTEIN: heat stress transcription factor A-4b-like [Phalaenopsis equestris]|uniref:LOW QUALITY PROTEIN: heat stress transcription factor A-4b-like n=1 Tax=Phalaenopsis equestris TaxID=78828 RepID=UPI0009E5DACD|nr:LOW QUALITY PROTEIN: heat stress transcription factor A-4b-like [Phalaenopsis equestris]